jgi:hypothetical protein
MLTSPLGWVAPAAAMRTISQNRNQEAVSIG